MLFSNKTQGVYLVSNEIWTPPGELEMSVETTADILSTVLDQESLETTCKLLADMPLSDRASLPAGYHALPIQLSIDSANDEVRDTFERAVKPCLEKHGYQGSDVTVVVTASNIYTPVPPQSARLCNMLGCNSDVTALNLTGTGESLGVRAISTAAAMLRARPEPGVAVVALGENMSTLLYSGRDDRYLSSNVSKRLGCACIILSTRRSDKKLAKYKLREEAVISKTLDAEEIVESFGLDPDGVFGFRRNEQFAYEDNLIGQVKAVNAMLGVDVASHAHVIVQPSHPEVIKLGYRALGLENHLEDQRDSSYNAFHRYGDVGLAGCWYALAHREGSSGIKKGDRVLLMAIGSNLHAGALVLEARKDVQGIWNGNGTSLEAVREQFERFYQGLPQRDVLGLKRASRRDEMLAQATHQGFYPYTHGVWSSDMARFKKVMAETEPLYRKMVAEGAVRVGPGGVGALGGHTTHTVQA